MPAGDGWVARVRSSQRSDGDFRCDVGGSSNPGGRDALEDRRQALLDGPWTWLRQVHGGTVVVVNEPGGCAGAEADAAVTTVPAAVLALQTADCAPVVVVGDGAVGVAHAGWRGVVAGVLGAVVEAIQRVAPGGASTSLRAVVGPAIRPSNYEFGETELAAVAAAARRHVGAVTSWGAPALDLVAAVKGALGEAGVDEVEDLGLDTAHDSFFSHRVRAEQARLATAVRLEPA